MRDERVISVSRRTDIPAFYSRWFVNRVRAGYCHWLNPFSGQVYRASLKPEDCLAIVFWTRNPGPLIRHLDELRDYALYFHVTLTGYPRALESHGLPTPEAVAAFRRLAQLTSPEQTLWRYDPIVLGDRLVSVSDHLASFERLAESLAGATRRCSISFVLRYTKTQRNLARVEEVGGVRFHEPPLEERLDLVARLKAIAARRDIELVSCCEDALLAAGIGKGQCVDPDLVQRLRPDRVVRLKAAPTRKECGCVESTDVGAYDTCPAGCSYCYATNSPSTALARMRAHDPNDSVLWRPPALRGVDLEARVAETAARR